MIAVLFWIVASFYLAGGVVWALFSRIDGQGWGLAVVGGIFWPVALFATVKAPGP